MKRTTRSQLRKGDQPWGGRLSEICQLTDRNFIEGHKDGQSVHNLAKVPHSVLGVNEVVGQRRFWCLPTEISSACGIYLDTASCAVMPGIIDGELDHWLRRRMRLLYWKQWKRPRTRRRNLLKLGAPRDKVHMATRSRKGPWRICNVEVVRFAMPNTWLYDQGLISLENQWVKARYGNQESTSQPKAPV